MLLKKKSKLALVLALVMAFVSFSTIAYAGTNGTYANTIKNGENGLVTVEERAMTQEEIAEFEAKKADKEKEMVETAFKSGDYQKLIDYGYTVIFLEDPNEIYPLIIHPNADEFPFFPSDDPFGEKGEGLTIPGATVTARPMTLEEITEFEARKAEKGKAVSEDEGPIILSDSWSGNVTVPINIDGTQGAPVGPAFVIAPHSKVTIYVGNLPDTMPSVNIGLASTINPDISWWESNVGKYTVRTIDAGSYANHTFRFKTSTNEANSRSAYFEWYTHN